MSPKLPVVTGKEVAGVALRLGFEFRRLYLVTSLRVKSKSLNSRHLTSLNVTRTKVTKHQRGSHAIYVRPTDKARVVIPMDSGIAIKPKTFRAIIQDLKLTVEEFSELV